MEDTILKIQRLLALSKSTNENEAHNAIMMAQRLLIKHKLSMKDVEQYKLQDIRVSENRTGIKFRGKSWKSNLAKVIANNFGCYYFCITGRTHEICFYGKDEDVMICNIMLEFAIKCVNLDGDKLIKRLKQDMRRRHFEGIKNDYALGFVNGLDERLKQQIKANKEWGLVLLKEQIVIDMYDDFSSEFRNVQLSTNFNKSMLAYKQGKVDGNKFDISNKIENEDESLLLG